MQNVSTSPANAPLLFGTISEGPKEVVGLGHYWSIGRSALYEVQSLK
jgi:hypothetical protein